ncbi:hypothetical protein EK904_007258 [Melospiza melodia maxima]|nr:hypothetical protein EK904_007258 [Melospiza melodia maxima]
MVEVLLLLPAARLSYCKPQTEERHAVTMELSCSEVPLYVSPTTLGFCLESCFLSVCNFFPSLNAVLLFHCVLNAIAFNSVGLWGIPNHTAFSPESLPQSPSGNRDIPQTLLPRRTGSDECHEVEVLPGLAFAVSCPGQGVSGPDVGQVTVHAKFDKDIYLPVDAEFYFFYDGSLKRQIMFAERVSDNTLQSIAPAVSLACRTLLLVMLRALLELHMVQKGLGNCSRVPRWEQGTSVLPPSWLSALGLSASWIGSGMKIPVNHYVREMERSAKCLFSFTELEKHWEQWISVSGSDTKLCSDPDQSLQSALGWRALLFSWLKRGPSWYSALGWCSANKCLTPDTSGQCLAAVLEDEDCPSQQQTPSPVVFCILAGVTQSVESGGTPSEAIDASLWELVHVGMLSDVYIETQWPPANVQKPEQRETLLHLVMKLGLVKLSLFLAAQPGGSSALALPNEDGAAPLDLALQIGHSKLVEIFTNGCVGVLTGCAGGEPDAPCGSALILPVQRASAVAKRGSQSLDISRAEISEGACIQFVHSSGALALTFSRTAQHLLESDMGRCGWLPVHLQWRPRQQEKVIHRQSELRQAAQPAQGPGLCGSKCSNGKLPSTARDEQREIVLIQMKLRQWKKDRVSYGFRDLLVQNSGIVYLCKDCGTVLAGPLSLASDELSQDDTKPFQDSGVPSKENEDSVLVALGIICTELLVTAETEARPFGFRPAHSLVLAWADASDPESSWRNKQLFEWKSDEQNMRGT